MKIDLEFFLDGADAAACRAWPAVPRVGDVVNFADEFGDDAFRDYEVYRIEWHDSADDDLKVYKNKPYVYVFLRVLPATK